MLWSAGIDKDNRSGRRKYESYIDEKAILWKTKRGRKALAEEWSSLRRGWYIGYRDFRDRLLDLLDEGLEKRPATPLAGVERKDHGEERAKKILEAGLRVLSLDPEFLPKTPKGSKEKRILAWFIKRQTTASLRWLSETLHMGHITNVSKMIREVERDKDSTYKTLLRKIAKIPKN